MSSSIIGSTFPSAHICWEDHSGGKAGVIKTMYEGGEFHTKYGLTNAHVGEQESNILLSFFVGSGFYTILLRAYFDAPPSSILDAEHRYHDYSSSK